MKRIVVRGRGVLLCRPRRTSCNSVQWTRHSTNTRLVRTSSLFIYRRQPFSTRPRPLLREDEDDEDYESEHIEGDDVDEEHSEELLAEDEEVRKANSERSRAMDRSKLKLLPPVPTTRNLSEAWNLTAVEVAKSVIKSGHLINNIDEVVPRNLIAKVAQDLGVSILTSTMQAEKSLFAGLDMNTSLAANSHREVNRLQQRDKKAKRRTSKNREKLVSRLVPRFPITTVMGHVNHGKTTLLDALRRSDLASQEAGLITQSMKAFLVKPASLDDEGAQDSMQYVTFMDTPGHLAFRQMRARGAAFTDIVVVVVASDEGVQPQTEEVVDLVKKTRVPVVVALTKCDKEDSNPKRVKNSLRVLGLALEDYGGHIPCVEISAKTGQGLDELVESLVTVGAVRGLKAMPSSEAEAVVVESRVEKGRGIVANIVMLDGTLKVGDSFVAGAGYGRIRALSNNFQDSGLKTIGPSVPADITGFVSSTKELPKPGDILIVTRDLKDAKNYSGKKQHRELGSDIKEDDTSDLKMLRRQVAEYDKEQGNTFSVIIKADTEGSLEAILEQLKTFPKSEVDLHILKTGIGGATETEIDLATKVEASIFSFNAPPSPEAFAAAEEAHVDTEDFDIIYSFIDGVKRKLEEKQPKKIVEEVIGTARVKQLFSLNKKPPQTVAGCEVLTGVMNKKSVMKIVRGGEDIWEGPVDNLKLFKADVQEVKKGSDCGITLDGFNAFEAGDTIVCFTMREVRVQLGETLKQRLTAQEKRQEAEKQQQAQNSGLLNDDNPVQSSVVGSTIPKTSDGSAAARGGTKNARAGATKNNKNSSDKNPKASQKKEKKK